jgi:hypothetical protein
MRLAKLFYKDEYDYCMRKLLKQSLYHSLYFLVLQSRF